MSHAWRKFVAAIFMAVTVSWASCPRAEAQAIWRCWRVVYDADATNLIAADGTADAVNGAWAAVNNYHNAALWLKIALSHGEFNYNSAPAGSSSSDFIYKLRTDYPLWVLQSFVDPISGAPDGLCTEITGKPSSDGDLGVAYYLYLGDWGRYSFVNYSATRRYSIAAFQGTVGHEAGHTYQNWANPDFPNYADPWHHAGYLNSVGWSDYPTYGNCTLRYDDAYGGIYWYCSFHLTLFNNEILRRGVAWW